MGGVWAGPVRGAGPRWGARGSGRVVPRQGRVPVSVRPRGAAAAGPGPGVAPKGVPEAHGALPGGSGSGSVTPPARV